jgi:hypothetical protein
VTLVQIAGGPQADHHATAAYPGSWSEGGPVVQDELAEAGGLARYEDDLDAGSAGVRQQLDGDSGTPCGCVCCDRS